MSEIPIVKWAHLTGAALFTAGLCAGIGIGVIVAGFPLLAVHAIVGSMSCLLVAGTNWRYRLASHLRD